VAAAPAERALTVARDEKRERLVLAVPGLSARAVIGSCCAAVSAAAAIEASPLGWPGVESVQIEPGHDRVVVVVDRDAGPRAADLPWSLRMLGLEHPRKDAPPEPNVNPF
jgi:hypothetical protein